MSEGIFAAALASKTLYGLSSSYMESKAIGLESSIEAQRLEKNARLAELQAKDAEIQGKKDATAYKVKINQLIGSQRASMAAQGIEVNADSALDIQLETKELGAVDAQTIRNNAFREATGYRIQSIGYSSQAGYTRISGKTKARNTLLTGGLQTANDLISGIYTLKNK